jgi:indolepyruvate ferredoxin oxidoreductase beta subunit
VAAQRLILADMDRLAVEQGSVISSSLFGALAGSGALPFPRAAFEEAIRAGGKGVEASLRGFAAGYEAAQQGEERGEAVPDLPVRPTVSGGAALLKQWEVLRRRSAGLPEAVAEMAEAGLRKVVDYQDCAYGALYLDRLEQVLARDDAGQGWVLSQTAAKYIANAMAYDDMIRVADLKTRRPRFERIQTEMGVKQGTLIELTEFFHPRAEEIASLLPARMGARWEANPRRMALLDRLFNKGRRLRTHSLGSFLMLHFLGGLKGYRLRTRRHAVEVAHLEAWLTQSLAPLEHDYALAVELLKCRRLVKGYSDTHAGGLTKFATVMGAVDLLQGRKDAAEWIGRLREAALQDSEGEALQGALATIRSFV